jgi:hypothetical protein
MVSYIVDLKKLAKVTARFLRRYDVPGHFSRSKNEVFLPHKMLFLYVLFCMHECAIDRFGQLIKVLDPNLVDLPRMPHFTTMWRAWGRFSPRLLRKLVKQSGRGGRDRCVAIDPTHFEITRPSLSYCRRTNRNPLREPNRKTTIATGTRSLRIIDAVIARDSHRHGLDDFERMISDWITGRTVVGDTEFDAQLRFHEPILDLGGKGIAPLRHKNVPVWRTKGSRRKDLRRIWPGRSYHRRPLAETLNSMLKRGMSAFLRGCTVWRQARHFYAKCLTHNLLMRCQ